MISTKYKYGDTVICKKNHYGGDSSYWYFRIFQKHPCKFWTKNKSYYILGIDDNDIPNMISSSSTEDIDKESFIKDLKKRNTTITNANLEISSTTLVYSSAGPCGFNNSDGKQYFSQNKTYFEKYFYKDLKEIRKFKLKNIKIK